MNEIYDAQFYGMGERYRGASLEDIENLFYKEKIIQWLKKPSKFLVMSGGVGTGKTHICSAIINEFWGKTRQCRYFKCADFIMQVKSVISQHDECSQEAKRLCSMQLLIFDDLGSSYNTEWEGSIISDIIDYRYDSGKPTIFTSNLGEDELNLRYQTDGVFRVGSRLFAKDNTILLMNGKNYRKD